MMPEKNIEWKSAIAQGLAIENAPQVFIATLKDGERAVCFWGSQDAREAQTALRFAAFKTEARGLPDAEVRRHASVSTSNRHKCTECFTCAAELVRKERKLSKV